VLEGATSAEINRGVAAHGVTSFELGNPSGPKELETHAELMATTRKFKASVLVLGHGSKGGIKDLEKTLSDLDKVADQLDQEFGKGQWLATFGGDGLNEKTHDIATLMRHLQQKRGAPILAIQSDKVKKEWGGVDKHIDYVHYVPTTLNDAGKVVWGGLHNGQPAGPTATYLGPDFTRGEGHPLQRVIAVGGGPITLDELKLAADAGIPISYVRSEAAHPEVNGPFGSVDAWALEHSGKGITVSG
jgi:hypothetical protein